MLIIKAEVPAGLTIEEAIREALELSDRIGCTISMEINDVPMLFYNNSLVYGNTLDERVENYHKEFLYRLENLHELKNIPT